MGPTSEELQAADAFRNTLLDLADARDAAGAPLWYGWALMDAFLAGIDYARKAPQTVPKSKARMEQTMSDPGCPQGHVWVTYPNAKVSVCKNCGADRPVQELPPNDPLRKPK